LALFTRLFHGVSWLSKRKKGDVALEKYETTIRSVVQPSVPATSLYANANIDVNRAAVTPVLFCFDNTQNKTVG
jgi:hypothetical protein